MAIDFDLFEIAPAKRSGSWTCLCGRFAVFVSESHYYNGEFDMYSYTVNCKRCGVVTVDCV